MSPRERPFRFGVLASRADDGAAWSRVARRAEDLGYHTLLVADHMGPRLAPMPALAAAAAATGSLRLGTLVIGNDFRHPTLLAMEAATVDTLSGGRLELGLGTGWLAADYDALGTEPDDTGPDPGGTRVGRLGEALDVIEAVWSGEPVRHRGDHYRVGLDAGPVPRQVPHPPLLLGGSGRRMLSLAARRGDIVSLTATVGVDERHAYWSGMLDAGERLDRRVSWIRDAAGERFDALELNVLVHAVEVTGDVEGAVRRIAGDTPGDPMRATTSPHVLVGPVDAIVDTLLGRRSRYGLSYVVVGLDAMEPMAPVVARLGGV